MPLFKFNRRKKLSLNRKSSSMGTIYQDYSGDPPLESGIINGHSKHGDHGMNLGGSSLDAIEPAADRLKKADSAPEKRFQGGSR